MFLSLQWVYMLETIHLVLGWCGLCSVDPGLSAEIALRLSLVLEASAACKQALSGELSYPHPTSKECLSELLPA